MNEPKPFASLSPGLLARKGQARPAMRPQAHNSLEDLGWNDMGAGFVPPLQAVPPVLRQQAEIVEEFGDADPSDDARMPLPRALRGGKAAFTLRLNAERHLKLRIACALRGRSAQKIVTEALDAFLTTLPELETMAGGLAAAGAFDRKTKRGVRE